jgi:predicted nucleotidyltransferase
MAVVRPLLSSIARRRKGGRRLSCETADGVRGLRDNLLLTRCREAIERIVSGATIILYGSRARGDAKPDADYDLLVLLEQKPNWLLEDQIRKSLYPLELETGAVLTVICYGKEEWYSPVYQAMPFVQSVEREGITI